MSVTVFTSDDPKVKSFAFAMKILWRFKIRTDEITVGDVLEYAEKYGLDV